VKYYLYHGHLWSPLPYGNPELDIVGHHFHSKMDALPIALISLAVVILIIGAASLANLALKKEPGPSMPYVPPGA
jgi:hypothetical protein